MYFYGVGNTTFCNVVQGCHADRRRSDTCDVSTRRPNWTSVPAARSSQQILNFRLYAIAGILFGAAAAGVFSFFAWASYSPAQPDLRAAVPVASGVARAAAEDYLDGSTASFPIAEGIADNFRSAGTVAEAFPYRSLIESSWRRGTTAGRLIETHTFVVTTATNPLLLTVPIALDGGVFTLAAYPTLAPAFTDRGRPAEPLDYQNEALVVDSVPQPIIDVIGEWGTAFASNDIEGLRRIVGDTTAQTGDYVGLGGFTLETAPVLRTSLSTTNGFVVRVRLVLATDGADGAVLNADYDILVQGTTTTLPRVVAWGPSGSGPTLERFQNRL